MEHCSVQVSVGGVVSNFCQPTAFMLFFCQHIFSFGTTHSRIAEKLMFLMLLLFPKKKNGKASCIFEKNSWQICFCVLSFLFAFLLVSVFLKKVFRRSDFLSDLLPSRVFS